jgi:serine/threonine protein phosphatase PrpC
VARVCGLAVSRSIGARAFAPFVIPDPDVSEVSVACRSAKRGDGSSSSGARSLTSGRPGEGMAMGDVWALLLCSDGVWDVLSDQVTGILMKKGNIYDFHRVISL